MTAAVQAPQDTALDTIKRIMQTAEGGPVVAQSIKRHYEHLESLATSLRSLGMDGREVDENIMQVFREYERELVNYVKSSK
jgi:hypothetical protein